MGLVIELSRSMEKMRCGWTLWPATPPRTGFANSRTSSKQISGDGMRIMSVRQTFSYMSWYFRNAYTSPEA